MAQQKTGKEGGRSWSLKSPFLLSTPCFTWAGSERWIEEDGMAAALASLREVLGFGFLDVQFRWSWDGERKPE